MLSTSPDIQVIGTALNGKKAMQIIPILNPDVICTDLNMPIMDGFQLTREVMTKYPKPILVISTDVQEQNTQNVFNLLDAGALDVFPKPQSGLSISGNYGNKSGELIEKIKTISTIDVTKKRRVSNSTASRRMERIKIKDVASSRIKVIVFGASIGGPQVLKTVLTKFPFDFPLPIFCVQRIKEEFLKGLIDWFSLNCKMRVRIAQDGEAPMPGIIYFPKERSHLELDASGNFTSLKKLTYKGYRPSITVTLNSVARHYGSGVIAVLLSGLGSDGLEGMERIANEGGITIAQSKESSVVSGTISQAIDNDIVHYALDPEEIPFKITDLLQQR